MSNPIVVTDESVGECRVTPNIELDDVSKFTIKALAGLQILCMGRTVDTDPKLIQVIEILSEACSKVEDIYRSEDGSKDRDFLSEFRSN